MEQTQDEYISSVVSAASTELMTALSKCDDIRNRAYAAGEDAPPSQPAGCRRYFSAS